MSRTVALGILAVFLHVASLEAQHPSRWGDELPPAPTFSDSVFAVPGLDQPVRWPAPPLSRPPTRMRAIYVNAWAFGGIYRHWLMELRDHAGPLGEIDAGVTSFDRLFDGGDMCDPITVDFLRTLPPQHRLALLLVYGEGFDYDHAAYVLDASPETVAGMLVKVTADLADRLAAAERAHAEVADGLRAERLA